MARQDHTGPRVEYEQLHGLAANPPGLLGSKTTDPVSTPARATRMTSPATITGSTHEIKELKLAERLFRLAHPFLRNASLRLPR
jgi:hypothetical protein